MNVYGHELLTLEQVDQFVLDPKSLCPACGEPMKQGTNPIRGSDSWWYTCPNKHALWVGK